MQLKKSRTQVASAVSLALASMMMATGLSAGVIDNTNNTPGGLLGACGTEGEPTACVGAWNLNNVEVKLLRSGDGAEFGAFDEATGAYTPMAAGDSFRSFVTDGAATPTPRARVSGKDWPVGEPAAIKVVNNDNVKDGFPKNCLINTAFLDPDYLRGTPAQPVVCSSPFQSHKRFKVAMLPSSVEGVASGDGKPIDLVFNVKDEGSATLRPYQVYSKINNYTGVQLKGYKIVVGRGVGDGFQSASALGISDRLQISLGIGEGTSGADLFDETSRATFSHGLFGAIDKHFPTIGFFDERTAGFAVAQNCAAPCAADTIHSTGTLASNYAGPASTPLTAPLFGDWLPSEWAPQGIFHDFDNDPSTDADLVAWWNGSAWVRNYESGFAPVSAEDLATWSRDPLYSVDVIEDVLNLGVNYIVKVGDNIDNDGNAATDSTFTVRIVPVVAETQVKPAYASTTPAPLSPTSATTAATSAGGGCAVGGDGRFDPILPALLVAGLGFFGWRRYKKARK